ncbi:beta-lactamase superfamily domain-containing protein [Lasiosphaeris hirsuta]|uniref:Beta-lactamase superfamily domain-containing protein n=1 Tax=Lasiosphaeris hirsuta TaxID=260670 RepID=A0AA40DUD5_9PEZI|nr:beta-lactamase superfamily domain-containing protein [Lasiosphaeris hirsuta]
MAVSFTTSVKKMIGDRVPESAALKPHHVLSKSGAFSRFRNIHASWNHNMDGSVIPVFFKVAALVLRGKLKFPDASPPTVAVRKPTFLSSRRASKDLRATWLGHACYYVEFPSGLRVLFDPVFEDACAPVSFLGPKRFTERPCSISEIPIVDAVVISHSHYDHLSAPSVHEIKKHHPGAHFFVGLGLEKWFRSCGIDKVTELDWWEDADVTLTPNAPPAEAKSAPITARFSCLPAQHSSGRTGFDKDKTLWCSWGVSSEGKSVFFGGDTGYRAVPESIEGDDYAPEHADLPVCPEFKQIGALRGPFDLGLIPIGAYSPRFIMSSVHANPFDAVEIFRDTRCKRAMGIHWGTWVLTFEEVLEPPRLLREALGRRGIEETGVFDVCDIGESRDF